MFRENQRPCPGITYVVQPGDSLFKIARRFEIKLSDLLLHNPGIRNPWNLKVGTVLCIPFGPPPLYKSIELLDESGKPLPKEGNFIKLAAKTTVRVTFYNKITHLYLMLTPTGTDTFTSSKLIKIISLPEKTNQVSFIWEPAAGTLGYMFLISCNDRICTQSDNIGVYRE
ncbi:LysM peptidoglycan-binding domain-containing protein [Carboxydothermus pertinax]|uniref:LysM domain-containing protein n=1 Tax=Carboxydothermus pertinax TaxID=870242 RepID=A0A1L8CSJ5_9THEO|nr:LysM domain-containing protein [Carboxydothermus pertinax]GAV21896.1 LysM domain-containing protein [Carboxydothermus pertinax]